MIICIVGKSGSGKSYITSLLKSYSNKIVNLDIDKIAHFVLKLDEVKDELIKSFGNDILDENNISRKKLGNIVFDSKDKMEILSNITWKYMEIIIDNFISKNQNKIIILDYLLLPKTKYFQNCDIRILIDAPFDVRMKRVLERDKITEEQFILRDKNGLNFDNIKFDYVIKNDDKYKIKRKVRDIYDKSIIPR